MPTVDLTRIGSNIGAMYSLQSLLDINNKLATHQTRLSTGRRLNSAADDPAGLTIATKMNARSEGLRVVQDNISDAKNMLSVAEGGLSKLTSILVTMRSKANQAASDTLGSTERATIQTQLSAFAEQIDDIINETKWNGVKLLDGTVSKQFQTGVDEGEYTTWSLSQQHTASALSVSEAVTTNTKTSVNGTGTSITYAGIGVTGTVKTGLTAVETGRYSLEILDKATDGTQGTVNTISSTLPTGVTGISATATPGAEELASGTYTFEVTGGAQLTGRTSVNYRILDSSGSVVETVSAGDLSAASVDIVGDGATAVGLTIGFSGALAVGDNFQFEYIAGGDVKYELNDGQNVAQLIDADGSGTLGDNALYGYAAAGGAADTGKGVTFSLAAIGSIVAGDYQTFDFKEAGTHVVDVSTATKAASYMTTVDNAMDVVNSSLADLGSLMARMTIKEEAASTARINVESAYNRIMNANMAEEQVNASKYMVLQQTAVAMLAQANQAPQFLLSLFQ